MVREALEARLVGCLGCLGGEGIAVKGAARS